MAKYNYLSLLWIPVGLTQTELERALATKFRSGYLKNPKITVTITNLRPFFITGESAETRLYMVARAASMFLQQSAIAGGPTYRANRSSVKIQHAGETTMRDYPRTASVPILHCNVIQVPERYFYIR